MVFGIKVKGYIQNPLTEVTWKSNIRKCIEEIQKLAQCKTEMITIDPDSFLMNENQEIMWVLEYLHKIADGL